MERSALPMERADRSYSTKRPEGPRMCAHGYRCIYAHTHTHIYIYREREREMLYNMYVNTRTHIYICLYIYICYENHRDAEERLGKIIVQRNPQEKIGN